MKRLSLLFVLATIVFVNCKKKDNGGNNSTPTTVISEGLKFCESTLWNGNDLYIANFNNSGNGPNPTNNEGKGYIAQYKDGKVTNLIIADGNLNAPKGTAVKDNYLFIADVSKIVVYNLSNLSALPQTITFADPFVNDMYVVGNILYVTETSKGKVYKIDITSPANFSAQTPQVFADVIGANGIFVANNTMYVASYPADDVLTDNHVIYTITDFTNPNPTKFINTKGFYDGIAVSADSKTLYFTDWIDGKGTNGKVGKIDIATKKITYYGVQVGGPAKLTIHNDSLYVADLPNSRVVVFKAN